MLAITELLKFLFDAYIMIILARVWMQFVRADFYNPLSQFVGKATQAVVGPLRRFIPAIGKLDTASLLFAYLVMVLKLIVLTSIFGQGGLPIVPILVFSLQALLVQFLWLIFYVLIVRAILSFVSQGNNPMEIVLMQLTEPFLAPVRRIIPPIGGLDFSVLVVILALQFVIRLVEHGF